jgi:phosphate uptake regulator
MKRKIMKLGPTTLVVSLPARWTRTYNLKRGDEIDVEERERTVTITTKKGFSLGKAEADLTGFDTMMKRIVAAKYLAGYDEIKVVFEDNEKARTIQKRAREFIGMDVVGQGKGFLVLKEISETKEDAFDPMLRRIFLLLLSIGEESERALAKSETNLDYIADMEANINNFSDYCMRILNKKGHIKYRKTPAIYCVVSNLELIGDEYKALLNFITKNRMKASAQQKKVYSEINSFVRDLYDLYYNFEDNKVVDMAHKRDSLVNRISKSMKSSKSVSEAMLWQHLYNITELTIKTLSHVMLIES